MLETTEALSSDLRATAPIVLEDVNDRGAVVYQRLLREGAEVPDYAMSAVLNAFRVGGLITASPRDPRKGEVRKHGDLSIKGVSSDLCGF